MTAAPHMDESDPLILAARWHDRLHSDPQHEELEAFHRWRLASVENEAAYARVALAWAEAREHATHPAIIALRHETLRRVVLRNRPTKWWMVGGAIAASMAIVGLALWWGGEGAIGKRPTLVAQTVAPAQVHTFSTAVGERLSVQLQDGSELRLDTGTVVKVRMAARARELTLERGQAMFEVSKDPARPFSVNAKGQTITAYGTRFNVKVDEKAVEVALVKGSVRVEQAVNHRRNFVMMHPNERLVAVGDDITIKRYRDLNLFISWTKGLIQFDNVTLFAAVREFNRYRAVPIQVDKRAAAIRVSGTFGANDSVGFIEAVQSAFPVKAHEGRDGQLILHHSPEPISF